MGTGLVPAFPPTMPLPLPSSPCLNHSFLISGYPLLLDSACQATESARLPPFSQETTKFSGLQDTFVVVVVKSVQASVRQPSSAVQWAELPSEPGGLGAAPHCHFLIV